MSEVGGGEWLIDTREDPEANLPRLLAGRGSKPEMRDSCWPSHALSRRGGVEHFSYLISGVFGFVFD